LYLNLAFVAGVCEAGAGVSLWHSSPAQGHLPFPPALIVPSLFKT